MRIARETADSKKTVFARDDIRSQRWGTQLPLTAVAGCVMIAAWCASASAWTGASCIDRRLRQEREPLSSIAQGSVAAQPETRRSQPLLGRGMLLLFVALVCCFTAWGVAQDLTTPMVAGFKRIFAMSTFQASLVQLAYFGAYFLLALPAAFINKRFGYKTGILTGLALAALGAFLFFPASKIMTYEAFLVALFAMAAGCSILETSANPYVMSLGAESTATRRLNLAQAFNPVGTNIGVLLASTLILPKLVDPVDISSLSPAQLHTIRAGELGAVMGPYLGLAFVLVLIFVLIAIQKAPAIVEEFPDAGPHEGGARELFGVLWRNKRYPVRRGRPVHERGCAGVLVDVSDSVRGAGARRQSREGRRLPPAQPADLPGVAFSYDLGHRVHPRDQGARGARVFGRAVVRVRDVEPKPGRCVRRRRAVLLPVADVPDDLRGRPHGPWASNEVRCGRPRHGDRRWGHHAAGPGQARGRDEPGVLVHRPGLLLRSRRALRAV